MKRLIYATRRQGPIDAVRSAFPAAGSDSINFVSLSLSLSLIERKQHARASTHLYHNTRSRSPATDIPDDLRTVGSPVSLPIEITDAISSTRSSSSMPSSLSSGRTRFPARVVRVLSQCFSLFLPLSLSRILACQIFTSSSSTSFLTTRPRPRPTCYRPRTVSPAILSSAH